MSFLKVIENEDIYKKYIKPEEFKSKTIAYGTAGFRTNASYLDWVMYRMGMLACLRSISLKCKFIGCMITASHNPIEDNGCKLVDPNGDMLIEDWEALASEIVNSNDLKATLTDLYLNHLKPHFDSFEKDTNNNNSDNQNDSIRIPKANIAVAHDTRPSCQQLLDAFKAGVEALKGTLVNYGLLSTPQLHYMVRCLNTNSKYGQPNEEGYFNKLSLAFSNIWSMIDFESGKYESELFVDGANGVGANKINMMARLISSVKFSSDASKNDKNNENNSSPILAIHTFNESKNAGDILNHLCGADYVKVQQKPPSNLPDPTNKLSNQNVKYCSFDGDADRIVYFYMKNGENGKQEFNLLDGDKISTLIAIHLKELVENAELSDKLNLCIVQTAYANGSSTDFIKNSMKVNVSCVPTGVKHLHHEAQKFDIGVYFEANGHGTILFSDKADEVIEGYYKDLVEMSEKSEQPIELKKLIKENKKLYSIYNLKHLKDCINQTVGDAVSDLLIVELILASRQMSISDWNLLYTDLPSRQLKVSIKDRNYVKTTDAERRVSQPIELQNEIDKLISSYEFKLTRAFVRPSGTEDVVRVYAESNTQENADELAKQVSRLVFDLAGGIGNRP